MSRDDSLVFGLTEGSDVTVFAHEPGEELWLALGFGLYFLPWVRMTPDLRLANVQVVKTREVHEVGQCVEGWDTVNFTGEC